MGQYIRKPQHVWKKLPFEAIADRPNILKEFIIVFFCCCCCCCYFGFRVIMFLPKTTTSRYKNWAIFFAELCFYLHHLKKLSQIFKILFSTGDIYNFVIRCVISVLHLKFYTTDFSSQKILAKISETHFYRKAVLV